MAANDFAGTTRVGDPYRELGIAGDATDAEIRAAFRRAARAHHSDVLGAGARPEARRAADAKFERLRAAHDVLLDPTLRRRLDTTLAQQAAADGQSWAGAGTGHTASTRPAPPMRDNRQASQPQPQPVPDYRAGSVRAATRELDTLFRLDARGMNVVAMVAMLGIYNFLPTWPLSTVIALWTALLVVQALAAGRLRHTPLAFVGHAAIAVVAFAADILTSARRTAASRSGEAIA